MEEKDEGKEVLDWKRPWWVDASSCAGAPVLEPCLNTPTTFLIFSQNTATYINECTRVVVGAPEFIEDNFGWKKLVHVHVNPVSAAESMVVPSVWPCSTFVPAQGQTAQKDPLSPDPPVSVSEPTELTKLRKNHVPLRVLGIKYSHLRPTQILVENVLMQWIESVGAAGQNGTGHAAAADDDDDVVHVRNGTGQNGTGHAATE